MPVDTRQVKSRRQVRYQSFEDLVADAERLAGAKVGTTANWSLGQTLKHLGLAMEGSTRPGKGFKVPWWVKVLGFVYLRRRLVYGPFPPGLQLPKSAAARLVPTEEVSATDGLATLRRGIEKLRSESTRATHPVAGALSIAEWDSFHLRHAELHMSFLHPQNGG